MYSGWHWLRFKILLVVAGIWWCAQIFNRRHEDIAAIRKSRDLVERSVIIGFWLSALVVATLLGTFGVATVVEVVTMVRDLAR
jgi:hypothetical protein